MTSLRDIALQCPVCGTWFQSVVATDAGGAAGARTDFHPRADGPEPVAYRVHLCAGCGFAGLDEEFASDEVSAASTAALRSQGTLPAAQHVTPSEKYQAAAATAERRGAGPGAVAELLLRAAWCCVAERDTEAERFFRREAARAFESALARYDDIARIRRVELTYLVGELWRRVGDVAQARAWFDRVAMEVTDEGREGWIVALAAQQRDEPREWLG